MKQIISNYCNNPDINSGLLLIDMPTGFGKTYNVLDYIYNASLDEANSNRKIFFITTLKKNLPENELKQHFEKNGKTDLFKEKFLFIDSNVDSILRNYSSELEKSIPYETIRKTDIYKKFKSDVIFVQEQLRLKDQGKGSATLLNSIRENLSTRTEPEFRRFVQNLLSKQYETVKDRLYAIKTDPKWQWLGVLYPAAFTRDKQIIFMSMDKFLVRNSTLVEPAYMFYNSNVIKDAIIFIDEIDATKETILKSIIRDSLKDNVDYLDLFKAIHSALHTNDFPSILTKPSNARKDSKYKEQSLQKVLDDVKEMSDNIFNMYSLQYSHRTSGDTQDTSSNFLFQDHNYLTIAKDEKNKYISTQKISEEHINRISFTNKEPDSRNNIHELLGKLRGFISYFQTTIYILAVNYQQNKNETKKPNTEDFTIEYAIRSVLDEFNLNRIYIEYLTTQILSNSRKSRDENIAMDLDLTFYEKGFRYYEFVDNYAHDMKSKIMMYSFQNTPEKILLKICEKAKVVGISATATIPTIIGNYDLTYIKSKLKENFFSITNEDAKRLKESFENHTSGYDKVSIHTELINGGPDKYSLLSWTDVYADPELAKHVYDTIERVLGTDNKKEYQKRRYLKIAKVYKSFILNDIRSLLCVLNKHPRKNDPDLDSNILEIIFDLISKENMSPINFKNNVELLDGEEYDNKKDKIIKSLSNGKSIFVISVYQTIGAGQNIQYSIHKSQKNDLVKINEYPNRNEKDFDAIYLDKPTNLMVNINNKELQPEEFAKAIFQTEYLQESGEVSRAQALEHIKRTFKSYSTGQGDYSGLNYSNTRSIALFATRTVIQAIGRICRTNIKNKNIYIFADEEIADAIDLSVCDNLRLFNPEFTNMVNKLAEISEAKRYISTDENSAALISNRVSRQINQMLRYDWTEYKMANWNSLRQFVLKHPTISKVEATNNSLVNNFYIKLPTENNIVYYRQENDYSNISVKFNPDNNHPLAVSAESARLDLLMKDEKMKSYFQKQGWATEFKSNGYIMSPALFNNIYKGALGEEIGKWIFKNHLNIDLEPIDDPMTFELFDFKVKDLAIYIDFKHWQTSSLFEPAEIREKVHTKAIKCGCKCAIVINLLSDTKFDYTTTTYNDVKIVEIPALVTNNKINTKNLSRIKEVINEFSN